MTSLLFALISVIGTALVRITLKHCLVVSDKAWPTLIVYHIGGALILLPFLGLPNLAALSWHQSSLLLISGLLFAVAGILDIQAMKRIDASSGEIFHTLTFILSVAAGFILFKEACSLQKMLGTALIAGGILYEARKTHLQAGYGFVFKLGAALFTALAVIVTKELTADTPSEIIILSGFIVPGVVYLVAGARDLGEILPSITISKGRLLPIPVFEAIAYSFAIKALALGEISTTYMVFQTTITAVLCLEVLANGWKREVYLERAISGGLCMMGALVALIA